MIPIEQILVLLLTSKVCPRCETRKGFGEFYPQAQGSFGLKAECKPCSRARARAAHSPLNSAVRYRNLSPEQKRLRQQRQNELKRLKYVPHPHVPFSTEEKKERRRQYNQSNKEKVRVAHRKKVQRWFKTRPEFKLKNRLRSRLYAALRGRDKSAKTLELLGCPILDAKAYIETKFKPGMTWDNYGPVWHVDHKRPCVSFDLSVPAQQRECFHYTNLQPLFAEENLSKGAKIS